MKQIMSITRKELDGYFGSPMALMFLGAFLAVTLFTFFWVETFFARNVADVRPLFRWMPVLLIFLVAALTMRQWSEEQRSGTLEILMTLPVSPLQLVLGKFLAVMALVALALALTLPLPVMVSLMGNLDWGPVLGGYLAALLLAAAYTAIGLFVSSRTDNQIVALISTGLLGGLFYLVGARGVTDFLGSGVGEILRMVGTGSRFESIERGVIDLRDLTYYLSLTLFFLMLNVLSLDSKRWSQGERTRGYRRNAVLFAVLVGANLLVFNIWLAGLPSLRVDITQERMYTLSPTTKDLLADLQEPLTIRAFISDRTHPLLMPLRPQIADMLREYEIAGGGMVTADVVDPIQDPELEAEANQIYGIRPVPFQVADRYESSVISSYFDILVRYGDQNVILNFGDLIDVNPRRDGTVDVGLDNLEYDLTSAVKRVVFGFQSVEAVLAAQSEPVQLTLFVTPDLLPEQLWEAQATIEQVAQDLVETAGGKLSFSVVNPDDPSAGITRQTLFDDYGMQPYPVALFSNDSYYLHMLLQVGDQSQVIYPSGELTEAAVRTAIESALKRASTGFLKVVGLWTPPETPTQDMFGQPQPPLSTWRTVGEQLRQEYTVRSVDLSTGQVPADIDVLMLVAPRNLGDRERFAVDQYLMRGGSVVVAAGNYGLGANPMTGELILEPLQGSLADLLAHYGVTIQDGLVMDPQNAAFPLLINRDAGGFQVQEIQAIDYPFFVDVRSDGMDGDSPLLAGLPAVTMNWASPVALDQEMNAERTTSVLLRSTDQAWLTQETAIQPDFETYPQYGFPVGTERQSYPLAVSIQGQFDSFFADTPSPLEADPAAAADGAADAAATPAPAQVTGVIPESPAMARLVVIGSAQFLDDFVLNLSANLSQDQVLNNLQFAQNTVDWAVEDLDLLSIRARGGSVQVLDPLSENSQTTWEIAQYLFALLALMVIGGWWQWNRRSQEPMELVPRDELDTDEAAAA